MTGPAVAAVLDEVKGALAALGYEGDLLQRDYAFTDVFSPDAPLRTIALAGFGQYPPSYRTACIGVVSMERPDPEVIHAFRALGAPQIFLINNGMAQRWQVRAAQPQALESLPSRHLGALLRGHPEWGPTDVLRAKSIGADRAPRQLDFFDAGLVPAIDSIVRKKLDTLLTETLAAAQAAFMRSHRRKPPSAELFRLVFRLLAAKVFADRGSRPQWLAPDVRSVLAGIESFYFAGRNVLVALRDAETQNAAWERIRHAFPFNNISVETLAHVYENTLVTDELRKRHGIHGTPPEIAEYVVRRLPFEELPESGRRTFEPCSGQGAFLVASLRRLKELLPPRLSPAERHTYLVERLVGIERDSFANEIARLSLMLADYPNPNGWRLVEGDVFQHPEVADGLASADAVLCNPPFENFTAAERRSCREPTSPNKAAEILNRVLRKAPPLLGFVLPRVFGDGLGYREARKQIVNTYARTEIVALPDVAFSHSEAESVLLIASGPRQDKHRSRLVSVGRTDYETFIQIGRAPLEHERIIATPVEDAPDLRVDLLEPIWSALSKQPKLSSVAAVHRGIEFTGSLRSDRSRFVSLQPKAGFVPGVAQVADGLEPYWLSSHVYLDVSPKVMRNRAHELLWGKPKVIANAARLRRGRWSIAAVPDRTGLVCYQNFHGIWPTGSLDIEVLTALLNNPLANAFVSSHRTSRHNRVSVIEAIPIPNARDLNLERITTLVRQYRSARSRDLTNPEGLGLLMLEIDAEVLTGYRLPARLERILLDEFAGERRPGPVAQDRYYPQGFLPTLPLRRMLPGEANRARAEAILKRIPVIDDPVVSAALKEFLADDEA